MKTFQIIFGILWISQIYTKYVTNGKESQTNQIIRSWPEIRMLPASKVPAELKDRTKIQIFRKSVGSKDFPSTISRKANYYTNYKTEVRPKFSHYAATYGEHCGVVKIKRSFPKVVGGENSEIGAWPWLALLAYDLISSIAYDCGGSLVTSHHVITAAHCIRDNLIYVRLGEYDLSRVDETQHLDVKISKMIQANFDKISGHNDLAILVLEKNIRFTDTISPICLPVSDELLKKSYLLSTPFVAGWGYTKESGQRATILQELQITILENKVCHDGFKAEGKLSIDDQFDDSIICAGSIMGGQDTCNGDSGGPLMKPEWIDGKMRFYLIGVVSRGQGCARRGVPGAYTNVPYHMDWILKNLI